VWKKLKSNELGFTFIEVIAAMTIMAVALIPIISIFPNVFIINRQVEHVTTATFLAEKKMEEIKSQIFSDFSSSYGEFAAFSEPHSAYKYIVTDDEGVGIKELSITVWYDENDDDVIDDNEDQVNLNIKMADRS
jgi:prepilin-type N-terminal cleavage/methylation domain-containing protein